MLLNHLKISFRSLVSQRGYTLINIMGLAVGIASALLIMLYVIDEFSYDRFHPNSDNIYRIYLDAKLQDTEMLAPVTNSAIGPTAVAEYPDILEFTRVFSFGGEPDIRYNERTFIEKRFIYADSAFFKIFDGFMVLEGDPASLLTAPNQMVMTRSTARRYFGEENATGKMVQMWGGSQNFEVVGVVEDIPSNSHIKFDIVCSFLTLPMANSTSWVSNNHYTYILLQDGLDPVEVDDRFLQMVITYAAPVFADLMGVDWDDLGNSGNRYDYFTQPLTDIHLNSGMPFEMEVGGNKTMVYVFMLIALFILIIAAINFMNLSTARASKRAREVGIRKIVGSDRSTLVKQFLTESVLVTAISMIIAIGIVFLALPEFNHIAGKGIILSTLPVPVVAGILIITLLVIGLAAGSYPAFFLASINPMTILKGKLNLGMKSGTLRGILVVIQFTITIGLLVSTLVVFSQMSYIRNKDLGYNPDKILVINRAYVIPSDRRQVIQDELVNIPGIEAVSMSTSLPTSLIGNTIMQKQGAAPDDFQTFNFFFANYDFDRTMGLKMAEGRYFDRDLASDSIAIVINQAAAKGFGFEGPAVGQTVFLNLNDERRVVGVIEDFHYETLHQKINPLVIAFNTECVYLVVRLGDGNLQESIANIEAKWNEFVPDQAFDYFFLDDSVRDQYSDDRRAGILFSSFSILAIIIASLGLLGLSSYSAAQRTREIGIRKVFGANEGQLVWLLLAEINRLFILATIISWPVAYYLMKTWLDNFMFRIDLSVPAFIAASLLSYIIAVLTVGYQALRASGANPAVTLKYE